MVRDSDPEPPLPQWRAELLLEELGVALRHVAVSEWDLPANPRALEKLERVREIAGILAERGVDPIPRIERLSDETGWSMVAFLEDCLAYPGRRPWVREKDGVRRVFRCSLCRAAEYPEKERSFRMCTPCLERIGAAIERRESLDGIFLYRTYTPELRCPHAGPETVLATPRPFEDWGEGWCARCIDEELRRRRTAPAPPGGGEDR
jgi:hypothetical protein